MNEFWLYNSERLIFHERIDATRRDEWIFRFCFNWMKLVSAKEINRMLKLNWASSSAAHHPTPKSERTKHRESTNGKIIQNINDDAAKFTHSFIHIFFESVYASSEWQPMHMFVMQSVVCFVCCYSLRKQKRNERRRRRRKRMKNENAQLLMMILAFSTRRIRPCLWHPIQHTHPDPMSSLRFTQSPINSLPARCFSFPFRLLLFYHQRITY